jgi:hypothetical protein
MTNAANAAKEQRSMTLPPVDWGAVHRLVGSCRTKRDWHPMSALGVRWIDYLT